MGGGSQCLYQFKKCHFFASLDPRLLECFGGFKRITFCREQERGLAVPTFVHVLHVLFQFEKEIDKPWFARCLGSPAALAAGEFKLPELPMICLSHSIVSVSFSRSPVNEKVSR
jgi:hypothetical protein